MTRWSLALLAGTLAAVLTAHPLAADDKKPEDKKAEGKKDDKKDEKAPAGVWTRDAEGGLQIKLDFTTKDTVRIIVGAGEVGLQITGKLTVEKDGTFKAKATKVEKQGDFTVDLREDYECSFKLTLDGKTAKLTDYKANDHEEQAKGVMEGEYTKDTEKKKADK